MMRHTENHEHHKHIKRIRLHLYTVYVFTILLLILQIITIYFLTIKINSLQDLIEGESLALHKKIDGDYIDTLNKIRGLSSSVFGIESSQTNLEEQLSLVKASTSADFSGIVESSLKSVATVATDAAQASGFFVREDGYLVTNAHVLARGRYVEVITYDKTLYSAQLVGFDLDDDIALLKVDGFFETLVLEDSDLVKVGEKVIAIGNPLGLSFTTTEGIVSAVDRAGPNGQLAYVQTDVSLNPGNSGGPLINKQGKVIGINNFKLSNAESIGFALESSYIKASVNEIALRTLNRTLI